MTTILAEWTPELHQITRDQAGGAKTLQRRSNFGIFEMGSGATWEMSGERLRRLRLSAPRYCGGIPFLWSPEQSSSSKVGETSGRPSRDVIEGGGE